jgi:hypothetical protein
MKDLVPYAGAIGTVLAALVAGAITFLVTVFTKESKVSEFRQSWIDGLRHDASRFIGIWYFVTGDIDLVKDSNELSNRKFWRDLRDEMIELETLQSRIELRLNPTEHASVIDQVRMLASAEAMAGLAFDARKREIDAFSYQIQQILKDGWEQVKLGEETYRTVRMVSRAATWIFVVLLGLSVLVAIYKLFA